MNKIAGLFLTMFLAVVTLSWEAPLCTDYDCASGYKVYCGSATGVYGTPVDVGAALSHPISTPGTYYCAATAYNEGGESGFSNEVFFTLKSAPGVPGNLRVLY